MIFLRPMRLRVTKAYKDVNKLKITSDFQFAVLENRKVVIKCINIYVHLNM